MWHRTHFLSFRAGFGAVPVYFVLPTPPRSVPGCGLGNRATHSIVAQDCWFLMFFPFSSCRSPLLGAGGDLDILATPTVAQDYVISCFLFFGGIIDLLAKVVALLRFLAFPSTHSRPGPPFR